MQNKYKQKTYAIFHRLISVSTANEWTFNAGTFIAVPFAAHRVRAFDVGRQLFRFAVRRRRRRARRDRTAAVAVVVDIIGCFAQHWLIFHAFVAALRATIFFF